MAKNAKDEAEKSWNRYRWEQDFMLPRCTYIEGYINGWAAGMGEALRVVSEHVSPAVANELAEIMDRQNTQSHDTAGDRME